MFGWVYQCIYIYIFLYKTGSWGMRWVMGTKPWLPSSTGNLCPCAVHSLTPRNPRRTQLHVVWSLWTPWAKSHFLEAGPLKQNPGPLCHTESYLHWAYGHVKYVWHSAHSSEMFAHCSHAIECPVGLRCGSPFYIYKMGIHEAPTESTRGFLFDISWYIYRYL